MAKLQAAYILGDYDAARRSSEEGEKLVLAGNLGMTTATEHVFYTALALSAGYDRSLDSSALLERLRLLHGKLVAWAGDCPENFAHKAALVGAEIARLRAAPDEATKLYRTAIDGASRNLFVQDEAIAHERRAHFLLEEQEPEFAGVHFRAARERYHRWGAVMKTRLLEGERPEIYGGQPSPARQRTSIDALALIKAAQAITAESRRERLFEQILRIIAEVGGAQSGAFVLCEHETLTVRARIDTVGQAPVLVEGTPRDHDAYLPYTILRYVLRSKLPLVLSDAGAEGAFANDPTVRRRGVRSVLCLPLTNQTKVIGLLYLENATLVGAFTGELVEILSVLAAQAAISLDNSLLMESLQRLTGELENRVTERTRQLADEIAARDKAEAALLHAQKMEAMGNLTGGVAHDFNNLLTPIVGSLDMLQRRGVGGERDQRLIAGAVQSAERAKTLVQRLLAFARRQPLQSTAVDVAKLVDGMADLFASTTGPHIKVVVKAAADLPPALADAGQLEMALLNLSVNARDAMPEGGTLRIAVTEEGVGQEASSKLRTGNYIRLSVADTGMGMDEPTLARAVEPFFSTKGVGKGTGLGLSMAHGLALQLGGALAIQSRPGLGTNVDIWLPVSETPAGAAEVPTDPPQQVAAAGRVLLVDDEELVRATTADMLADLGYDVVEAASGDEALRLIRDGLRLDLLVTDHIMPGITGTDLARILRLERPDVRILLVSGYADGEGVAPELPRLAKPFRGVELASSLAELTV